MKNPGLEPGFFCLRAMRANGRLMLPAPKPALASTTPHSGAEAATPGPIVMARAIAVAHSGRFRQREAREMH
ncbi:MAG: hypothetical protein ABW032_05225, partial [Burkholderiaceae bacterium]